MTNADAVELKADIFSDEMFSDCCSAEVGFADGEIGLCSDCGEWVSIHRGDDPDYV